MIEYVPNSKIDCFIVVPPNYRPQLFADVAFLNGNNLRAHLTITERKHENRIQLAGGRMDIYKLGEPSKDLQLQIVGSDAETEKVIEEISRRNIPVYIYPRVGGNVQLNLPLVRGAGVDPLDTSVTDTFTVSTGTTVYMPRADSGRAFYLTAVDTSAALVDGVMQGDGITATQLPTGRGMMFPRAMKNMIKDSLMTNITYVAPYAGNWEAHTSAADTWGTDHGTGSSVRCADAKTYWTKSTTTTLKSPLFNFAGGTTSHISFNYRINGTLQINLKDSGGTIRWSKAVSLGSGRLTTTITGVASYANAYFEFSMISGTFIEIDSIQLMNDNTLNYSEFLPFLGTSSTTTEAEITARYLVVTANFGGELSVTTSRVADRKGSVMVSGYVQPMFGEDYKLQGSIIAQLRSRASSCSGYIGYGSSGLIFGLQTGGTSRDTAAITGHKQGDVYAFGLWSGYNSNVAATRFYCVRLRDSATYTCDYAQAIMFPYQLNIGSNYTGGTQADCVIAGVSVETNSWKRMETAVTRLADTAARNVIRDTIGRWYILDKAISPKRYKTDTNAGTYTATEVRQI